MSDQTIASPARSTISLHKLGVFCGLAAAVWLGSAEAPTKLVNEGFSPFLISMGMVMGAFVARWTVPTLLKGTGFLFNDLREKPHLIVWALIGGMLWAVGNTLTIFAVRNVGLAIAFPLWNTNSLVGLAWGCLLFKELHGSKTKDWAKVIGGAAAIVFGAAVLAIATAQQSGAPGRAATGIIAALGAGCMFGTMYIPYRKAYISGMNPLSFVTIFTFGELGTILTMGLIFYGGAAPLQAELARARTMLFWPFVGGFCWVIGDLFQQYAAKYIGIGRGYVPATGRASRSMRTNRTGLTRSQHQKLRASRRRCSQQAPSATEVRSSYLTLPLARSRPPVSPRHVLQLGQETA